jgi:hypothetical protein
MQELEKLIVSAKELSNIFGISERSVYILADKEIIPRIARGRYEFLQCLERYLKFLRFQVNSFKGRTNYQVKFLEGFDPNEDIDVRDFFKYIDKKNTGVPY